MPLDAQLPHAPLLEAHAQAAVAQPLWSTLTRWWAPVAAPSAEADLGYESALPWMLAEPAPAETRPVA